MASTWILPASALALLTLSACSGSSITLDASDSDASPPDTGPADGGTIDSGAIDAGVDAGHALGDPIPGLTAGAWGWVDFPDTACDDGSPTGLAINTSSSSSDLLIFLAGGGACWDAETCLVLNTAVHGPYGRLQFDAQVGFLNGGLFSRVDPGNVFRGFNYVIIPYCTGDEHAGSNVASYTVPGGQPRPYHHVGHLNFLAYLKRLAATFRTPARMVLSGSSAGGYGAALNYLSARTYWPGGKGYLIDDSGPLFAGTVTSTALSAAVLAAWHIGEVVEPLCGTACDTDGSQVYAALATRYPADRFALLSSLQDRTIRSYLSLTAVQFQQALLMLAADVLDPLANFKYFFVAGETHTMLITPTTFSSQGTGLPDWLRQEVFDDRSWGSLKP